MKVGDEITVSPVELVAGGDALARIDGFPVFASNVFPGDVAVIRLHEVKKGFAKGDLVRLVEAGPWRRAEPCPIAGECGGCDWTALRLDRQLEAKRRILTESLRRIGKFAVEQLPPVTIHPSPLNYRIRSRLHEDRGDVGFFAMRSNRVVPLSEACEVVGVQTARNPRPGTTWEIGNDLIPEDREIELHVDGFTWQLSTRSFFQVNRHMHATMIRLVTAHAARCRQRQLAIDLYAGVGFFTVPLARHFERVVAVEGSAESARYARRNAPQNVLVVEAAVEQHAGKLPVADFVFLDPPRAGARQEVVAAAASSAREMICYLSCDPVTFSRDANRLRASGWRLATLDLLDLFPNTHHVETLATFERSTA
ncbi:MAG TPA: TRAM domain-containing protein [Thermoanaerobaculia bacterium]|nr:TRAM domain-containing protein [Thermoanaerobaculia bacterium]